MREYAAYDPELDRRIAIKLVAGSGDGARMTREAKALARLAHPNIVAIHDVGTHGDRVWIAMELVDGETLAAWARGTTRTIAAALRVLVDGARGVAAAHAAGLVHRDLKPENVMIDRAGRVRVMDFGLAHGRSPEHAHKDMQETSRGADGPERRAVATRLTADGAVQGTPAYMAPEQWRGLEVGAAADQFSWCVMAWELLYGERPHRGETVLELADAVVAGRRAPPPRGRGVPAWLRRTLERGLQVDPTRRWPSMDDLLVALRRGRARARARWLVLGLAALALLVGGVASVRRHARSRAIEACLDTGVEIDAVWNDAARSRLADDRVAPWFDLQASAWRRARGVACLESDVHRRWDDALRERSLWCLEDRRLAIASLIDELTEADARVAQRAVAAAAALPPIEPCVDVDRLRRQPAGAPDDRDAVPVVRAALARADALRLAGKYDDGLARARDALDDARTLEWPPLVTVAALLVARLQADTGDYAGAEATAIEVYFDAAKLGAWELAAEAATLLTHFVGNRRGDLSGGVLWARDADVAIGLAGDRLGLREANRVNSLANVYGAARRYEEARALHEEALAHRRRVLGPDHPDVAWALNNLAIDHASLGDLVRARALHEEALQLRRRVLGPTHPDVANSLFNLATVHRGADEIDEAQALHEEALAIRERALGGDHPDVAQSRNSLALLHAHRGDLADAQRLHERVLAVRERVLGEDHPDVAQTLTNLGIVYSAQGAYADAAALHERALAIRERVLDPVHADIAASLVNIGSTLSARGSVDEALEYYQRAHAILVETRGPEHPDTAQSLNNQAILHLQRGDHERGIELHREALAIRER
ncbi:MAG: serine/threonine protein kinase, partial [Myxococcales bacterium]|nr:serine/threonine protein kinase [Myxococcales bacterium]